MSTRQRFRITVEAAPSTVPLWNQDVNVRLRQALKVLWRRFDFRCLGVVDVLPDAADANVGPATGNGAEGGSRAG